MSTKTEARRVILGHMILQAIKTVDPVALMLNQIRQEDGRIYFGQHLVELQNLGRIVVIGTGKAGEAMARGLEKAFEVIGLLDRVEGIVNVPDGIASGCRKIEIVNVRPQGQNAATERVLAATQRQVDLIASLGDSDILIDLISGGGSATRELLYEGIRLVDLSDTVMRMQSAGAEIQELNAVRKLVSQVKGGKMNCLCRAGKVFVWVLSDVVGDPLTSIASGPWAENTFSPEATLQIMRDRNVVTGAVFDFVQKLLQRDDWQPITPCQNVYQEIIGSNAIALKALGSELEAQGYRPESHGSSNKGYAREVGARLFAESVQSLPKTACLYGGETSVQINRQSAGLGGRCQTMALSFLEAAWNTGLGNATFFAFGTDGEDGPTSAAGAFIDQDILENAKARYTLEDVRQALADSNEHPLLNEIGALIVTGLTGTNVYDIWGYVVAS